MVLMEDKLIFDSLRPDFSERPDFLARVEKLSEKVENNEILVEELLANMGQAFLTELDLTGVHEKAYAIGPDVIDTELPNLLTGNELFVKLKGGGRTETIKITSGYWPTWINFYSVPEEKTEGLPGIEMSMGALPILLNGDSEEFRKALSEGKIVFHNLSKLVGKMGEDIDMSDFILILNHFRDEELREKIGENLAKMFERTFKYYDL